MGRQRVVLHSETRCHINRLITDYNHYLFIDWLGINKADSSTLRQMPLYDE